MAQIAVEDRVNVDDYVCGDELEEPAKDASDAGGEDDGAGRGDVGV